MASRTYFTGSDGEIEFRSHPDPRWNGQPLDVAHFVMTAGSSPIPIYNYANRQDSEERPYLEANREENKPMNKDPVGGATFDDVAQGNEIAELQLAVNQQRFTQVKAKFQSMTDVGDAVIRYTNFSNWDPEPESVGYELIDGTVNQVGEEISVGNATFPSITITFRYAQPLGGAGPSPFEETESGEGQNQDHVEFVRVGGVYRKDGKPKSFHPRTAPEDWPTGDPILEHDPLRPDFFDSYRRKQGSQVPTDKDPEEWFQSQSFIGAFLEEKRRNGRRLWIWSPKDEAYELAKAGKWQSSSRSVPILEQR